MRIGVTKLSFEYSTFTLAIEPFRVQVMFRVEPMAHASPPTVAVSVRQPLTVKAVLDSSETVVSAVLVTRTFTLMEAMSGIVHAYVPAAAEVDDVIRLG